MPQIEMIYLTRGQGAGVEKSQILIVPEDLELEETPIEVVFSNMILTILLTFGSPKARVRIDLEGEEVEGLLVMGANHYYLITADLVIRFDKEYKVISITGRDYNRILYPSSES